MHHLLIDTNVYLAFYGFPKDDIEELGKLVALIKTEDVHLHVNDQIRDEFLRNREKVVQDHLKKGRDQTPGASFPQMIRIDPAFEAVSDARKVYEQALDGVLTAVESDARERKLAADSLIDELFAVATIEPVPPEIVTKARDRFDRGNPPGKKKSYGDAITWETALAVHPHGEPLHLITRDGDYESPLRPGCLHQILDTEWTGAKASDVHLYVNLTEFFKAHYPNIKLASDVALTAAITALVDSYSFKATHAAISTLDAGPDLSDQQAEVVAAAALKNNQIRWVLRDAPVRGFYRRLLEQHGDTLDQTVAAELQQEVDPITGDDDT